MDLLRSRLLTLVFFAGLLIFSLWLMWHTFSYDPDRHFLLISAKVWSDFGTHLPLIRYFTFGRIWPLEHPLYPGAPIRYHFLFYLVVGLLERMGMRLDWALNLLSGLGFFLLLVMIWKTAIALFHRRAVAFLALIFFLFNGSFSFLDFFAKYPPSRASLSQIVSNVNFPSFGPWSKGPITAFWNLNIYTNQRHLGLSFAVGLLLIYFLYTQKRRLTLLTGFILGGLLFLNQAVFAVSALFALWFFLTRPALRFPLLLSFLGFLPWLLLYWRVFDPSPAIIFQPGFLISPPLTPAKFISFWFLNFGLYLFLIPLGFILAPRRAKILIPPLLLLFILPNLFRLSTDMINNHKFFNFFLLLSQMYVANLLVRIWSAKSWGRLVAPVLLPFLIFGGLIDFFPILHDPYLVLPDYPAQPDVNYFLTRTAPGSVVLNSTWFYHPASLAGRPIYNGYSYFTWSFGYDQTAREQSAVSIYRSPNKAIACRQLLANRISYVELNDRPENFILPNFLLWRTEFVPDYTNPASGLTVYSVNRNCTYVPS